MKLLIVSPIFPPEIGGPATYTWELAHRLKDHEVEIVAFGDEGKKIDGIPVHLIRVRRGWLRKLPIIGSLVRQADLKMKILRYARGKDLVYVQGPLVVGWMTTLITKFLGKKTLLKFVGDISWETAHRNGKTDKNLDEFLANGGGGMLRRLQKCAFRRAHGIVVPSQYLKDVLTTFYKVPLEKVHVIYNAATVPATKKEVRENTFVTVGRLVPHKNIAGIIEAMSFLPKKYILRVIGTGPEGTALRELAHKLDVNVKFLGALPRPETLQEIANAELFILNSNYEGLPHTVVEAMYLGTTVVASDILGTTEVATEHTAVLAKANNPEDLAAKIEFALGVDITDGARDWVEKRFNWEQNLDRLSDLFARLGQK